MMLLDQPLCTAVAGSVWPSRWPVIIKKLMSLLIRSPSAFRGGQVGRSVQRAACVHDVPATRRAVSIGAGMAVGTVTAVAGLMAAGSVAAAVSAFGRPQASSPKALISSGMAKFRSNAVEDSLEDFDAALAAAPQMLPYLWQRGLSLYYVGRFEEGAKQFREDVAVNPNDTEEAIWTFLCEAQLLGADKARQQFLKVGRDPRPVMRAAYECFLSGAAPESILKAAAPDLQQGGHDAFYANLYVGLWYESHGDPDRAKQAMLSAVATPYARLSGDYMASLSMVHAVRRSWLAALP